MIACSAAIGFTSLLFARLRSIGLDFPDEVPMTRVNVAYRKRLMPIARATALFTARSVENKRTLLHLPFWFKGRLRRLNLLDKVSLFGPRIQAAHVLDGPTSEWIAAYFWSGNQWLQERMGMELGTLGYPIREPKTQPMAPRRAQWIRWIRK
jgi:hypothetical protein